MVEVKILTLVGTQHWSDPYLFTIMSHLILGGAGEEGENVLILKCHCASSLASYSLKTNGLLFSLPKKVQLPPTRRFSSEDKLLRIKSWISESIALPDFATTYQIDLNQYQKLESLEYFVY